MKIQLVSSNLEAIEYDQNLKELSVWFKNKKTDTEHYVYEGVEPDVFGELMLAPSKGKYFALNLKSKFNFKKVESND